jgi:hypothetical protein
VSPSLVLGSEHLVQIPPDTVEKLKQVVGRHGGFARWGIRELEPYALFFEADRLVDVLLSEAAEALNALMRETDVLRLPNVDPKAVSMGPPNHRSPDFSPRALHTIRCLAGLCLWCDPGGSVRCL